MIWTLCVRTRGLMLLTGTNIGQWDVAHGSRVGTRATKSYDVGNKQRGWG